MRAPILAWSALSGVMIGLLIDVLLVGVWLVATQLLPGLSPELSHGPLRIAACAIIVLVPAFGGILGLLEGRLKSS